MVLAMIKEKLLLQNVCPYYTFGELSRKKAITAESKFMYMLLSMGLVNMYSKYNEYVYMNICIQ